MATVFQYSVTSESEEPNLTSQIGDHFQIKGSKNYKGYNSLISKILYILKNHLIIFLFGVVHVFEICLILYLLNGQETPELVDKVDNQTRIPDTKLDDLFIEIRDLQAKISYGVAGT